MKIDDFLEVCQETMDEYKSLIEKNKIYLKEIQYWRSRYIFNETTDMRIQTRFFEISNEEMEDLGADDIFELLKKDIRK